MRKLLLVPFLLAAMGVAKLPPLTPVNPRSIAPLVADPAARSATARTINAYRLNLPAGVQITDIGKVGATPVNIRLSNGQCILIHNGRESASDEAHRIEQRECSSFDPAKQVKVPLPPRAGLRFVNTSFGFTAWRDDRRHITLIADAFKEQRLLYSTSQDVLGITAIRCPDCNGADMSIVAREGGRIVVTLNEVTM